MILVNAHQITKAFGVRPLFEGITFSVQAGDRIGLIGPNGAGKSTLMRILAKQSTVDKGTVSFQKGVKVGFLEQVPTFPEGATILSAIMNATDADDHDWELEDRAREYISRLELDHEAGGLETPVARLSGGWKKRVALARELARQPDLLLLDEPTNHLDVTTIRWLEDFLARVRFATLTVTHDRMFLQRVSNRILELDRKNANGLLDVRGDYSEYLTTKADLVAGQESREASLKNTLRRETEWLRQGAKARTTKQQARINRAGDLKNEVEELSYRNRTRSVKLDFESDSKNPKKLVEAKAIRKTIETPQGTRTLFKDVDLIVSPTLRLGLLGPNGCGKSTFIKTLLGNLTPDSGSVKTADNLQVAYFEQNRESLDPTKTLMRTFCPTGDHVDFRGTRVHVRGYLDRFLFGKEQMEMPIGKLSGGEQSRILIAKLMLEKANLLVLDEPTNDLDIETLDVLENCLRDFDGAVILVSHDRFFMDQVSNRLLAFDQDSQGELIPFADLHQYEQWLTEKEQAQKENAKKGASAPAPAVSASTQSTATVSAAAPAPPKKRLGFKEQRELDGMEDNIARAEKRLATLTEQSTLPENLSNASKLTEMTKEMSALETQIAKLYERWAELTS